MAGVDEAGRGALAGPVVAAAVIFTPKTHIPHVTDSKALPATEREKLARLIKKHALCWAVGLVSADLIDVCNILRATCMAMREAISQLHPPPEAALIDGRTLPDADCAMQAVIGGDRLCFSIAAASIIAKVTRDQIMTHCDRLYPGYGFARHKGYGSSSHLQAIVEHGPCPIHRMSFAPFSHQAQRQLDFK